MANESGRRKIEVREATRADIPDLMALNRAAYPDLAVDNIVWTRAQLMSHLRIFPQGQIVAILGGEIVGAVASLIVDLGPDPLRLHTLDRKSTRLNSSH